MDKSGGEIDNFAARNIAATIRNNINLLGRDACQCEYTPEESYRLMTAHLAHLLPKANEKQIARMLK